MIAGLDFYDVSSTINDTPITISDSNTVEEWTGSVWHATLTVLNSYLPNLTNTAEWSGMSSGTGTYTYFTANSLCRITLGGINQE